MSNITATTLVSVQHSTGVQITAHIPVEKYSTRLQTRLKTLKKYVSQYPRGWKKRLELADVLYTLGNWSQAIPEYYAVLHRQPRLLSVRLRVSTILYLLNRSGEAIALYQSALEGETDPATCHHIQGKIYECEQSEIAATLAYQKAIDAEPRNAAHWYALAQSYTRQDEFEKAVHAYDHILELQPKDAIAISHSADLLWHLSAHAESISRTKQVLAIAPDHAPAIKRLVDHRCRIGLLSGKEGLHTSRLLKRLQKLAPGTPETLQSQAYYHWYSGNPEKGTILLANYCQENPLNPFGQYYNALFLFHLGRLEEAAHCIWDTYQLLPEDISIFETLCEILPRVKNDSRVDLALNKRLSASTNEWRTLLIAGRFLAQYRHDYQRSCSLGKRSVELKPKVAQVWFQYGEILTRCQSYQRAIDAIATGWELLPTQWFCASSIPAAVTMAECHQALGNKLDAETWWNEVIVRSHYLKRLFPQASNGWNDIAHQSMMRLNHR